MCDRCFTTPIDPEDTEYLDTTIQSVTFVEDGYLLGFTLCGEKITCHARTVTPPPQLDEALRLYGVDTAGGSLRGVVIGTGETARTAMYRTKAHEAQITQRVGEAFARLLTLRLLLANDLIPTDMRDEAVAIEQKLKLMLTPERVGDTVRVVVPTFEDQAEA